MQVELNRKEDKTVELTVTIPWSKLKTYHDKIIEEAVKTVSVKGFRKGKAPRKLAEEKLDKQKVFQKTIQQAIPKYYTEAIKGENIKPIVNPQIQLTKAAPENDLVFKAVTAEAPEIELGDYKKALSALKGKKSGKIWTPGQPVVSQLAETKKKGKTEDKQRITLDDILKKLLEHVKLTLPSILVEQQTNQNLTQLIDQVKQVGMNIQQYAQSKGKTVEEIRKQTQKEAENTLKLEFILESIADKEKIVIDDKEIDAFISKIKDEKEKKMFIDQRYQIASLLRRQKTLKKLLE
jgi:FKBP-type peptidyl-prolyl cis-trans isomerase (trigger factor)